MNRTLEKPVYIYISLNYTSSDRHNDKNVVVAVVVLAGRWLVWVPQITSVCRDTYCSKLFVSLYFPIPLQLSETPWLVLASDM